MAKIFFAYSHKDEKLRDELEVHLSPLKKQGLITTWHDRKIGAGDEFESQIDHHISNADIILLLISPYFLDSDYCTDIEMVHAIERHEKSQSKVIPIILHPCDWKDMPFGNLLACPTDGKPISSFNNQHEALFEVERAIKKACQETLTYLELREVKSNILPSDLSSLTSRIEFDVPAHVSKGKKLTSIELFEKSGGLICTNKFSRSWTTVLFVYGSLLSPISLFRTIVRDNAKVEYIPAKLKRQKIVWEIPTKKKNLVDGKWFEIDSDICWESIVLQQGGTKDYVPGALIDVEPSELKELQAREENYTLRLIKPGEIELLAGGEPSDRVIKVFVPKKSIETSQQYPTSDTSACKSFAVRHGYYSSINHALEALNFNERLPTPLHNNILSAFEADNLAEYVWRSAEKNIPTFHTEMHNMLKKHTIFREKEYLIPMVARPLVLKKSLYSEIAQVAEATVSLTTKGLQLMLTDRACAEQCGYCSKDLEIASADLLNNIQQPDIARVDLTLFRGKLNVFEVNSDSPGGMFHIDFLSRIQAQFCEKLGLDCVAYFTQKDTCEAVKNTIIRRWQEFSSKMAKPMIPRQIIILERTPKNWNTYPEFEYFKSLFSNESPKIEICDPRELKFSKEDCSLSYNGQVVDLVYKRILSVDFERPEMREAENNLRQAYSANSICIVNSLSSRMAGCKFLLAQVQKNDFEDKLKALGLSLTDIERDVALKYIPKSVAWRDDEKFKSQVLGQIEEFVLKSYKGFGSKEVIIGENIADAEDVFNNLWGKQYIVQKRIPHGRVRIPFPVLNGVEWKHMYFTLGAYVINGKCEAIEAKVSKTTPVGMRLVDGIPSGYRTAVFPTI